MTTNEQRPVIGIFRDRTLAEQALNEIRQAGWSNDQTRLIGQQQGGGLFSSLKGSLSGSQNFTSDDPVFQGLTDEQRNQYQHAFEQGSSIVAVYTDTHTLEVRDTLHRFGAMNVLLPSYQGQERVIPLRREDVNIQKNTAVIGELRIHKRIITENKTFTVPVTREEVTIERLPVSSSPNQQPVQTPSAGFVPSFHVPTSTTQRDAVVQPASGQVSPPFSVSSSSVQETSSSGNSTSQQQPVDMATIHEALESGGSLRILVHEEQVMIQKQSVVVEEILIQKQVTEETRHLSVPVRHEEAHIERHGTFPVHGDIAEGAVEAGSSNPLG